MWSIKNLRADNDSAYPSLAMRISADAAEFWNPVTKCTEGAQLNPASNLQCAINSCAPGFRDQTYAYSTGDVVWFYLIWSATLGITTINSRVGPGQTNGGGTTGPTLSAGYTSYCPCFAVPLIGTATLQPSVPQGGVTSIRVRGDAVSYLNPPGIQGTGYPTMNFDLSAWLPSIALMSNLYIDAEIHSSAAGGVIGGAVASMVGGNNFANLSLYPPIGSSWAEGDVPISVALPDNRQMSVTFMASSGVIDKATADVFVNGYTLSI